MPGGTLTLTSLRPMTWPYHFETWSAATIARAHVTTSTPRTRRSSTEIDTTIKPTITMSDTCHGVAYRGVQAEDDVGDLLEARHRRDPRDRRAAGDRVEHAEDRAA